MSPIRTFQSCGNSSSLVFRSIRPTRVVRTSLPTSNDPSSVPSRTVIERNLASRNGLPPSPIRFWRKNGPPGLLVATTIMMNRRSGDSTTRPQADIVMSRVLFNSNRPTDEWAEAVLRSTGSGSPRGGFRSSAGVRDWSADRSGSSTSLRHRRGSR